MAQKWKCLPLPQNDTVPPLLFSYTTSSKGYDLFLTDLVHLWSESLNKKQILSRASKDDASIDPSEDDDQFSVLLQKIGAALQGLKGSMISLGPSTKGDYLELTTSTPLPSPLEPLEWRLQLAMLPQDALTRQILVPVLKGEKERSARIQSLIDLLNEKDRALGKIFEKIESSGVDLSRAFPGLSGKPQGRKGESAVLLVSKAIKGVAPFDEAVWNSGFTDQESGHGIGDDIATELGSLHSNLEWGLRSSEQRWWAHFRPTTYTNENSKAKKKEPSKPVEQSAQNEETVGSDDEFQRQETPPRLKQTKPSSKAAAQATTETTDENKSASLSPVRSTREAAKGIGSIGSKSKKKPSKRDEPTESESDEPEPKPPKSKESKKSKGLGSLGAGKGRPSQKQTTESTASGSSDIEEDRDAPQKKATPDEDETASESDGESEAQRKLKKKHHPRGGFDGDDDDDQGPRLAERKAPKSKSTAGIGQIGGKKRKESEEQPSDKPETVGDEETSDTGDRNGQKTSKEKGGTSVPGSSAPTLKASGKLGTIGGGKAHQKKVDTGRNVPAREEQTSGKDDEETESGSEDEDESTTSKAEKKLKDEELLEEPPSRPRSPGAANPPRQSAWPKEETKGTEEKEETPEERANRKREELRRRLETKGPAKKKRKF